MQRLKDRFYSHVQAKLEKEAKTQKPKAHYTDLMTSFTKEDDASSKLESIGKISQ